MRENGPKINVCWLKHKHHAEISQRKSFNRFYSRLNEQYSKYEKKRRKAFQKFPNFGQKKGQKGKKKFYEA